MPISGNSSATITAESPNQSSTLMSFPPGTGMRLRSSALRAAAYHSAARAASRTTMWGVMVCIPSGIAFTLGSVIVVLLDGPLGSVEPYHRITIAWPDDGSTGCFRVEGTYMCSERKRTFGQVRLVPRYRTSEKRLHRNSLRIIRESQTE